MSTWCQLGVRFVAAPPRVALALVPCGLLILSSRTTEERRSAPVPWMSEGAVKMLRRFPVGLSAPAPPKLPRDVCGQPRPGCALWQAVCWPQ